MSSSINGHADADRNAVLGVETNKEREEKLRHLQKEIFQLANYYFVFQGVIFTSIYSGPHSHEDDEFRCRYRWFPITLSSLAWLFNFSAFVVLALSYKNKLNEIDEIAAGYTGGSNPIPMRINKLWRNTCLFVCMLGFLGFFTATIFGCLAITCLNSYSATAAPPSPAAA